MKIIVYGKSLTDAYQVSIPPSWMKPEDFHFLLIHFFTIFGFRISWCYNWFFTWDVDYLKPVFQVFNENFKGALR